MDWKTLAAIAVHKGLIDAAKYYASKTPETYDDMIAEAIDKLADFFLPLPKDE